jgi:hypothetical protein
MQEFNHEPNYVYTSIHHEFYWSIKIMHIILSEFHKTAAHNFMFKLKVETEFIY